MSSIGKFLTGVLGILAVVACLATIGVIGYSISGEKKEDTGNDSQKRPSQEASAEVEADGEENMGENENPADDVVPVETPQKIITEEYDPNHIHDYEESVEKKATCYQAGRLLYTCNCGDYYYVDISSTGHVADDWKMVREATKEEDGLKVKKCIYCDETIAQEVILYKDKDGDGKTDDEKETHVHMYTASIVREPSCVLAGLRRYSCTCGSFYTEPISALGHIATDWTVAEEPTTTMMGREQRICNVCGVVLDSRPLNKVTATPTAGATASASSSASPAATISATAKPSASATPAATPGASPENTTHSHNYTSYVLKESTCSEKGIRSYVCTCGSSYAELMELDMNNHSYKATITSPTSNSSGFTTYKCIWCDYSYVDNYIPPTG